MGAGKSRDVCRNFYPRSPCGERPLTDDVSTGGKIFLSTLSLRRATEIQLEFNSLESISIHALLAESDRSVSYTVTPPSPFLSTLSLRRATYCHLPGTSYSRISIHALLAESDPMTAPPRHKMSTFLSTLSLRRATVPCWALYSSSRYFYPRSPCGERQLEVLYADGPTMHFYPRSPCGERLVLRAVSSSLVIFLSTLSLRRATHGPRCYRPR